MTNSRQISARKLVQARREISCFLDPGLFADPAYDLLLGFFAAEETGQPLTIADCSRVAQVPQTTTLRWISLLQEQGLLRRSSDRTDEQKSVLELTDACRAALRDYLDQVSRILNL